MNKTKIEWTDMSWNPVTGCTKISPGCDHCYAERIAERFRGQPGFENGFDVTLHLERLSEPLHWKKRRIVLVNSMSDLFHKDIPQHFIHRVFDTMEQADQHVYQVLTKRSSLMRSFVNARYSHTPCPAHIWLGVSVESAEAKSRIVHLQDTNATVRFLSIEPLIAPVGELNLEEIHWVIAGGESGPNFRPMQEEWALNVRDQCATAQVAFFFKQWGGRTHSAGGRLLQGREWNEYPQRKESHSNQKQAR